MYKTMVLSLLEERPEIHDQLRKNRALLPALNRYASQLKARHEAWMDRLSQAKPGSAESQLASEALVIALQELKDCLTSGFPGNGSEFLSLEGAMAFIRAHKPPA